MVEKSSTSMSKRRKISWKRSLSAIALSLVLLSLGLYGVFYGVSCLRRPPRTDVQQPLFQGIVYRRIPRSTPRPLTIHVVTIDLKAPGIGVLVTPGKPTQGKETVAQTTSDFLREFNLQLAINGSFFYPFQEQWLLYYPHSGEPVNVLGQAISNGVTYSAFERGWPVLCFSQDNRAQISKASCPADTAQALAGGEIIIERGNLVVMKDNRDQKKLFPRTVVATDESGEKLWLILVDGRQRFYSEGVSIIELQNILAELGVYRALNLDGGGSTTLVVARHGEKPSEVLAASLNSPIHTRIPMRQRPVANHLGFYARPIKIKN